MTEVLALTRLDVADYVDKLFLVYLILIFIRIVMTWFPRIPYNPVLSAVLGFVQDVTDPWLKLFRRFVPMVKIGPGALDLSPIVATFVLLIIRSVVVGLIAG